jgi:hypothetical protein
VAQELPLLTGRAGPRTGGRHGPARKAVATMKTRERWIRVASALAGLAMTLGASAPAIAYHETLLVTVNGTRLTGDQIRALEQI